MKKYIALLISILVFNTVTYADFVDLDTVPWATSAINALVKRNVITGLSHANFNPNSYCTRADFTVMLCKAFDIDVDVSVKSPFKDVTNEYYAPYINGAYNKGFVYGESYTIFNPKKYITRQDATLIIYNYLKLNNFKLNSDKTKLNTYTDYTNVPAYAKNAFACLLNADILQGSNNELRSQELITRAEVAVLYEKLLTYTEEDNRG